MVKPVTAVLAAVFLLFAAGCTAEIMPVSFTSPSPGVFYVSPHGDGAGGRSWATAWRRS